MVYAVALSGGVDSAVAAHLMKQQHKDVFAIFMRNWQEDNGNCASDNDLSIARSIASQLDIELHVVNFAHEYQQEVFQDFIDDYTQGLTPNPDILCNKNIKFKHLLQSALDLGANTLVTGHYARIEQKNGHYRLLEGIDVKKDQSYFLCAVSESQLAKAHFPLGELTKKEVRLLAKTLGLINHNRKDSTGICFVEPKNFQKFLKHYILSRPGDIVNQLGQVLGRHSGLSFYTIGQRQGLNIGGLAQGNGEPWYVASKDFAMNRLIICQGRNNPMLFSKIMKISKPNFSNTTGITARIRHLGEKYHCEIQSDNNGEHCVQFSCDVRAVTPGQYAAFYLDDRCLGYARIL